MPSSDLVRELRQLENLVARVQHGSSDLDHKHLYSYIEEKVLSQKSELVNEVPPLYLVIHTIKTILYPMLVYDQIPDLLDLLATAEFYRGRSLDKARDAVTWSDYYMQPERRKEGHPLTIQQREELSSLEHKKNDWRKVYLTLVHRYCYLDLYYLWTAKTPSMTNFFIRFNEYFPFLTNSCSGSPRLFYKNLSDEECLELGEIGLKCCDFAQDAMQWGKDQQSNWSLPISNLYQTKEFGIAFPLPDDFELIYRDTQKYLDWTQDSMTMVMKVFQEKL